MPTETPKRAAGPQRADVALVEAGLFESRARAAEAIAAGLVTADGAPVAKPASRVPPGAAFRATAPHPYVSRGGVKLAAGLDLFALDPAGLRCLDVGSSTGGFTDVLLRRGAAHVTAVDVGRDQLHPSLRGHPRVDSRESTDIRALALGAPVDMVVCDASFVSLRVVLPPAFALAAPGAVLVALVKPQFEAGRAALKKGIVRDPEVHAAVCRDAAGFIDAAGWRVLGIHPSPIAGGDGNLEFLLGARRRDV
ncbi:TlyA family RNA methyltransferase [Lichenibacterium minor]|uniref:TlyA family RNA methyltransferase n=1 Tax=Lichenibacterium minor TaxID=2316528 RepID=A0A4Q2UBN7_9HYPH|nr:TlyA family RNA methyltransferase [Lichenibacterium minor]RYC32275.1 TlyA family RNA methyltransferase [Lichenibacterium minor]